MIGKREMLPRAARSQKKRRYCSPDSDSDSNSYCESQSISTTSKTDTAATQLEQPHAESTFEERTADNDTSLESPQAIATQRNRKDESLKRLLPLCDGSQRGKLLYDKLVSLNMGGPMASKAAQLFLSFNLSIINVINLLNSIIWNRITDTAVLAWKRGCTRLIQRDLLKAITHAKENKAVARPQISLEDLKTWGARWGASGLLEEGPADSAAIPSFPDEPWDAGGLEEGPADSAAIPSLPDEPWELCQAIVYFLLLPTATRGKTFHCEDKKCDKHLQAKPESLLRHCWNVHKTGPWCKVCKEGYNNVSLARDHQRTTKHKIFDKLSGKCLRFELETSRGSPQITNVDNDSTKLPSTQQILTRNGQNSAEKGPWHSLEGECAATAWSLQVGEEITEPELFCLKTTPAPLVGQLDGDQSFHLRVCCSLPMDQKDPKMYAVNNEKGFKHTIKVLTFSLTATYSNGIFVAAESNPVPPTTREVVETYFREIKLRERGCAITMLKVNITAHLPFGPLLLAEFMSEPLNVQGVPANHGSDRYGDDDEEEKREDEASQLSGRACENCRSRKRKSNRQDPCENCTNARLECTYPRICTHSSCRTRGPRRERESGQQETSDNSYLKALAEQPPREYPETPSTRSEATATGPQFPGSHPMSESSQLPVPSENVFQHKKDNFGMNEMPCYPENLSLGLRKAINENPDSVSSLLSAANRWLLTVNATQMSQTTLTPEFIEDMKTVARLNELVGEKARSERTWEHAASLSSKFLIKVEEKRLGMTIHDSQWWRKERSLKPKLREIDCPFSCEELVGKLSNGRKSPYSIDEIFLKGYFSLYGLNDSNSMKKRGKMLLQSKGIVVSVSNDLVKFTRPEGRYPNTTLESRSPLQTPVSRDEKQHPSTVSSHTLTSEESHLHPVDKIWRLRLTNLEGWETEVMIRRYFSEVQVYKISSAGKDFILELASLEDVKKAYEKDGKKIAGIGNKDIKLVEIQDENDNEEVFSIYIDNLPPKASKESMINLFKTMFPSLKSVTMNSVGCGTVQFMDRNHQINALKMESIHYLGQKISITEPNQILY